MKIVKCKCGCGEELTTPNKYGREKKYIVGHNRRKENPIIKCACGCGEELKKYHISCGSRQKRRFINGHWVKYNSIKLQEKEAKLQEDWKVECVCGCGYITKRNNRFIMGHNTRLLSAAEHKRRWDKQAITMINSGVVPRSRYCFGEINEKCLKEIFNI